MVDESRLFLKPFDKGVIFFSAFLVLCNYYYLYFVEFYQGAAGRGWFFSILKLLGVFLVAASLLRISPRWGERKLWFLMLFFIGAFALFFLKGFLGRFDDKMFLNAFLCIVPFLIFRLKQGRESVLFFFECCLLILIFQVILDQLIFWSGNSLWENRAFVGGLGNPSSFGLLCNVLLCYVLFERRAAFSSAFFAFVLAYGVCRSNSLVALISFVVVLVFCFLECRSLKRFAFVLAIFSFSVYLGGQAHLFYKIDSLVNLAFEEMGGLVGEEVGGLVNEAARGSVSISTRVHIHYEYFDNLLSKPVEAVFYGFTKKAYMAYDSQLLTYLSSFGLLFSLLFFLSFSSVLFGCLPNGSDSFVFVALFIFGLTFLTNRILDYYPMPILFALLIVLASDDCSRGRRRLSSWRRSFPCFFKKTERLSS